MRTAQVVQRAADYLERHGVDSPIPTAERLLARVLETDRTGIYARDGLTTQEAKSFGRVLCRRCAGEPLQHVTGEQGFRRIVLRVRPGVFVPRPETEVLVQVALDALTEVPSPTVVDVGTGCGAIALARENADALDLAATLVEGDLLEPLPGELRGKVDAVVSNPPYVSPEARDSLPADVLAEPELAVFGGVPLYGRLFTQAVVWLRRGGLVAVEIEEHAARDVVTAAEAAGLDELGVHPDLAGRDRVVRGRRPPP